MKEPFDRTSYTAENGKHRTPNSSQEGWCPETAAKCTLIEVTGQLGYFKSSIYCKTKEMEG